MNKQYDHAKIINYNKNKITNDKKIIINVNDNKKDKKMEL